MYLAKNNDLTDSLVGHGAILFELFDLFFHQLDGTLQALLFFLLQVSPLRNATQQKNGSVWARRREPNIRFSTRVTTKKKKKKGSTFFSANAVLCNFFLSCEYLSSSLASRSLLSSTCLKAEQEEQTRVRVIFNFFLMKWRARRTSLPRDGRSPPARCPVVPSDDRLPPSARLRTATASPGGRRVPDFSFQRENNKKKIFLRPPQGSPC